MSAVDTLESEPAARHALPDPGPTTEIAETALIFAASVAVADHRNHHRQPVDTGGRLPWAPATS